jgi:hypothetical protein
MTRRLFNLLTALSLLLCVAVVALWVRSYYVADWVGRANVRGAGEGRRVSEWGCLISDGLMMLAVNSYRWPQGAEWPPAHAG